MEKYFKMRSIAIIPAYNEEKNIKEVIEKTKKYVDSVLVINDGSIDRTREIAEKADAILINLKKNHGKGYALRKGFEYAIKNKFDRTVTLDADLEHDPHDIPLLLKNLKEKEFIGGGREKYKSVIRKLLNLWASFWIYLVIGKKVDATCGFRAYKISALKKLNLKSIGFEIDLETLLEATNKNLKFSQINISENTKDKGSNMSLKNFLELNNFFDRWIISNYNQLQISRLRNIFLVSSAYIGLLLSNILEVLLWILRYQ